MFSRIALFTLVASAVAVSATAVPFAEHAQVVAREVEPTTTSTEIVYVTITRTLPNDLNLAAVTNAPNLAADEQGVSNKTEYLTNASGHTTATVVVNGTISGTGPKISDEPSSAAVLKAGSVMGLIGLGLAFLL